MRKLVRHPLDSLKNFSHKYENEKHQNNLKKFKMFKRNVRIIQNHQNNIDYNDIL